MLKQFIIFFWIITMASQALGFIEQLTILKHPQTGQTVVICADSHFLGTLKDNEEQAQLFFKVVLPQIHKKLLLSGSGENLGIFVEAMNFYKFNNDNILFNFNALSIINAVINHKNQDMQSTWISHKLPWQFIEKYSSMSFPHKKIMFLKSIDPRLPIEFFRNLIVRMKDNSVLSLPAKGFMLSDIINLLNHENKKIIEKLAESTKSRLMPVSLFELLKIVDTVFKRLYKEQIILTDILKKDFISRFNLKRDWKSDFGAEAYENDYDKFLKRSDIVANEFTNDSFEDFIFNNKSFSELVDLIALIDICIGGPKYSIVFAGAEHAIKLIDYLQKIGFNSTNDDILNQEENISKLDEEGNVTNEFKNYIHRKFSSIPSIMSTKKFKSSSQSDIFRWKENK